MPPPKKKMIIITLAISDGDFLHGEGTHLALPCGEPLGTQGRLPACEERRPHTLPCGTRPGLPGVEGGGQGWGAAAFGMNSWSSLSFSSCWSFVHQFLLIWVKFAIWRAGNSVKKAFTHR